MKLRVFSILLILTFFAGLVYAQAPVETDPTQPSPNGEELGGSLDLGDALGKGGCSNIVAPVVEKLPKFSNLIKFEAKSGVKKTHGIFGLFRLGAVSAKEAAETCEGSESENCKVVNTIQKEYDSYKVRQEIPSSTLDYTREIKIDSLDSFGSESRVLDKEDSGVVNINRSTVSSDTVKVIQSDTTTKETRSTE